MTVSFEQDILPLFTQTDIDHMRRRDVLLDDYGYMKTFENAKEVYDWLRSTKMPPGSDGGLGPWPDSDIDLFQSWLDGGFQP